MKKILSWGAAILAVFLVLGFFAGIGGIDLDLPDKDPTETTGGIGTLGPEDTGVGPGEEETGTPGQDKEPEILTRTISGVWKSKSGSVSISQYDTYLTSSATVSFTYEDGLNMYTDGATISLESGVDLVSINGTQVYNGSSWTNDYVIIDFGTSEQTVSVAFYQMFISAFASYTEGTQSLDSAWELEGELELMPGNKTIEEEVSFYWTWADEIEKTLCDSVTVTGSKVMFGTETVYEKSDYNDGWLHTDGVLIDFVVEEQPAVVSNRFYDWLVANGNEVLSGEYTLSGVWIMNETLTAPSFTATVPITFSWFDDYNGGTYTATSISVSPKLFVAGSHSYSFTSEESVIGWDDHYGIAVLDFDEAQAVSKVFYEWFVANASQSSAESVSMMVYGEYEANSSVTYVPSYLVGGSADDLLFDTGYFDAPSADDGNLSTGKTGFDFGEEGREVSLLFYLWLIENYTPVG